MFRMNGMTRVHGCTGVASLHNTDYFFTASSTPSQFMDELVENCSCIFDTSAIPSRGSYSMAVV